MRIVHVNLVFQGGTTARQLIDGYPTLSSLARWQVQGGAAVTVLQRFDRDEAFDLDGVRYEFRRDALCRPEGRGWMLAPRLITAAAALTTEIVHVHGLDYSVHAAATRLRLPRPTALAVQDHGVKPTTGQRGRLLRRALLAAADGILLNTIEMGEPLRRAGILPARARCFAVREWASSFEPIPQAAARFQTGLSGSPLVLWVGRLDAVKDPLTAIEGFCLMARDFPDARLALVYQRSPALAAVRALTERHALTERVSFVGAVANSDLPRYYSSADLFLTSSHWEGSNYALIESMACGLWPVCSSNPSHRGMLDGQVGTLFEPGDARACASALREAAVVSNDTRIGRARQVRAHFDRSLSWPALVRQSFDAYEVMLAARRRRYSSA
jgi:glycosyltransferase involved in cell wall biosynthesis